MDQMNFFRILSNYNYLNINCESVVVFYKRGRLKASFKMLMLNM